jgi:hypothetical protein
MRTCWSCHADTPYKNTNCVHCGAGRVDPNPESVGDAFRRRLAESRETETAEPKKKKKKKKKKVDAMSRAVSGGAFESNRRRH